MASAPRTNAQGARPTSAPAAATPEGRLARPAPGATSAARARAGAATATTPEAPAAGPAGDVRYGTAGWSFPDWYGCFYPTRSRDDDGPGALFTGVLADAPDPDVALARREPLRYYARYFDAVEVNVTFYRLPGPRATAAWARVTERRGSSARRPPFLFSVKLPMAFTHEGVFDRRDLAAFRACVAPLAEPGRLACVLAQFPQPFTFGPSSPYRPLDRLRRLADAFRDPTPELPRPVPLAVEVRHESWGRPEAEAFLRELGVSAVCVDQPQGRGTLPPRVIVTNPRLAYVRLHGQNHAAWFDREARAGSRYDYTYTEPELDAWATRIDALSREATQTLVVANNHARGQAPAAALGLRARRGDAVLVPAPLGRAFPSLAPSSPHPGDLPDLDRLRPPGPPRSGERAPRRPRRA